MTPNLGGMYASMIGSRNHKGDGLDGDAISSLVKSKNPIMLHRVHGNVLPDPSKAGAP